MQTRLGVTVTHMNRVGVRELRQSLSRPIARLVAERGATLPRASLLSLARSRSTPPAVGPPSLDVLDELREERL
jgi:antitoxin (DNA-binding transcriptional repressor) of toxin-antitoxin stability system